MSALTFRQYLKDRKVTDTAAGDFVADAKADRTMPDAKSWSELESYLVRRSAIPDAIAAAKVVWRGYLAKRNAKIRNS